MAALGRRVTGSGAGAGCIIGISYGRLSPAGGMQARKYAYKGYTLGEGARDLNLPTGSVPKSSVLLLNLRRRRESRTGTFQIRLCTSITSTKKMRFS